MSADLSVVICSLNGSQGVLRCLRALNEQRTTARIEVVVVDDGSTDDTAEVARSHGAIVIRHGANQGIAAARNSGLYAAGAPIVAYLDDDCKPEPDWAHSLLTAYDDPAIVGVGGVLLPDTPPGFMRGYLQRHNPLRPLELELAESSNIFYRLYLYVRSQWKPIEHTGKRDVYSFVGANMSFRRQALIDVGGFDSRLRFGPEELDLSLRLSRGTESVRFVLTPEAKARQFFLRSLRDTLRRSRAYGKGSARLFRKWPSLPPTFFPVPVALLMALLSAVYYPALAASVLVLPQVFYPQGVRDARAGRGTACLLDAYVRAAQEACSDVGFVEGLWQSRSMVPEGASPQARIASQV